MPNQDTPTIDGYGDQVVDASSMLTVFRTNSAYAKIATPVKEVNGGFVPDPTTRLLTDDVPFGLCILKDLALRLKVETPGINIALLWMRTLMGKEYFVNGELRGKHMNECGILEGRPESPLLAKIVRRCGMCFWKAEVVVPLLQGLTEVQIASHSRFAAKMDFPAGLLGNYGFLNDVDDVIAFAT